MKSLLVGLVIEADTRAQSPIELNAVARARIWIANGDAALTLAGKLQAYKNAIQALRPALFGPNTNGGFAGKANDVVNDVSTATYSLFARVFDWETPGTNDRYDLKLIGTLGLVVSHLYINPATLRGSNSQVPKSPVNGWQNLLVL